MLYFTQKHQRAPLLSFFNVISYSKDAAPRQNCLHSHCLRHISSEAGHKCGSCIQTGKVGSRCRWESGLLEERVFLLHHHNTCCNIRIDYF